MTVVNVKNLVPKQSSHYYPNISFMLVVFVCHIQTKPIDKNVHGEKFAVSPVFFSDIVSQYIIALC